MSTTTRQTAEERRSAVLGAATHEFARKGLYGTSTDDIARAAGISQPYLFRLFGSKQGLYLAAYQHCVDEVAPVDPHGAANLLLVARCPRLQHEHQAIAILHQLAERVAHGVQGLLA